MNSLNIRKLICRQSLPEQLGRQSNLVHSISQKLFAKGNCILDKVTTVNIYNSKYIFNIKDLVTIV